MADKRLTRSTSDRWLAGVCGGIGEYTGWDPNIIRIITIVLVVAGFGTTLIAYIVAWILMPYALPEMPTTSENRDSDSPESTPPAS